jgi:hypothetical protein
MKQCFAFIALATGVTCAIAQQKPTSGPTDPAAPVPQAKYESAFTGYVPYREQDLAAWREANDEVARIGGHIRMFGAGGHAGHGAAKPGPARPAAGEPAASKSQPAIQPPERSAPQAPQGAHQGH